MEDYKPEDIKVLKGLELLRANAWIYVGAQENLLSKIMSSFLENLIFIGVKDFTYVEMDEFITIQADTDWMAIPNGNRIHDLETVFTQIVPAFPPEKSRESLNRFRAEALLTAFYFDYYTNGTNGEYGNKKLLAQLNNKVSFRKPLGRYLVIEKTQRLPDNHNISHERRDKSLPEIENEIRWLTLMKEQLEIKSK